MTKDDLLKRIAEIEKAINQNLANHNVLLGGLQECKFWLAELEKDINLHKSQ
jgi:hypothetical protein